MRQKHIPKEMSFTKSEFEQCKIAIEKSLEKGAISLCKTHKNQFIS